MPAVVHVVPSAEPDQLVSISIVSHRHGALVHDLLNDIASCCKDVEVLLTVNVEETLSFGPTSFEFPLQIIRNAKAKGFSANHNAAFAHASGKYFCVLNPDIRLNTNPFPVLIGALADQNVGVAAPRIVNPSGETEDSARRFPTLWVIARKALTGAQHHDYDVTSAPLRPEWVAGMFMLFRKGVFSEIAGFDERYFLYYEDVDLCRRLRKRGFDVRLIPSVEAIHDARRQSRRSLRHLRWHVESMLRYFLQPMK